MARTTFDPTVAMTYPLAQGHHLADDGILRVRRRFPHNAAQYPSAFAYSIALDLANFALLHLRRSPWRRYAMTSSVGRSRQGNRHVQPSP